MAAGKSAADILAGVKEDIQHTDENDRLTRPSPTPVPEGLRSPAPKHEYSDAPYSLVKKSTPPGSTTGDELNIKKNMVDKARKALE
jgi:hypothetical protein